MADDGDLVLLRDRYELKPATRLAQFDHGAAQAYAVEDRSQSGRKLFALVCSGTLPCRGLDLPEYRGQMSMLWPEATGVVDWPVRIQGGAPIWGRRPALVYPQPAGERMAKTEDQPLPQLNEQTIARTIIKPALQVLRELGGMEIAHRAIRPTNIFYASGNSGEVVFGECFGTIPGSDQPVVFETIENGMADRKGRAVGSQADDLYALGVLLLMLNMGRNPMLNLEAEAIVAAKINFGTFSALAGGEKVSPTMAEMLRGLLSDKVSDRWTLRNLDMWMAGQYFNPVLPVMGQRATRPIRFAGGELISRPAVAHAMTCHWDEAVGLVDGGTLESWLRRSFNDDKIGETLSLIRGQAFTYGSSNGTKHRAVSRMIQFMAPSFPLCYKSIRVDINALGSLLASVIDQPQLRTEFVDVMRGRLPQGWLDQQPKLTPDMVQSRRILDGIEKMIDRPGPGYSVERVLYELDLKMPCRSELIGDYYVTGIKDLLPAIDAALPGADAGTMPVDRHIAAFIAARIGRTVDRELNQLDNMADQISYRLGVLRLIAAVQRQHAGRDLPRLAAAMVEILKPVTENFHRLRSRGELQEKLRQCAAHSDFVMMAELLDEEGPVRRIDDHGFAQAQKAYGLLEKEARWLEGGGMTNSERIYASARTSSAITAAFLASAVIAAFAVLMAV